MRQLRASFVVIGSGIAGLSAAHALSKHGDTILLTKKTVTATATDWAQGGIAAAMTKDDRPQYHYDDTISAGDGICDTQAVKVLVEEGPARVKELIELGACFDREGDDLKFTREAAHQKRRILHAGDATGKEIEKTLGQAVLRDENVTVIDNAYVLELITSNNECGGCLVKIGEDYTIVSARATIVATGGLGQIYSNNTNPTVATGDGIALAKRAGAQVQDMEFVQFHPTTLSLGDKKPISLFLISEAVRGEGAILRNQSGSRFMPKYHEKAELAPRDVVSRAIYSEMRQSGTNHVYLDLSTLSVDIAKRFPTIYQRCLTAKIDITKDFIPVSPAAHYHMGGVQTDLWGQTTIPRLFAAGEVACTGLHGANRLASNSLLEGLVFGARLAEKAKALPEMTEPLSEVRLEDGAFLTRSTIMQIKLQLRDLMWQHVGIIRDHEALSAAVMQLQKWRKQTGTHSNKEEQMELINMITVAELITTSALSRTESRGAHFRSDHPKRNDKAWQTHQQL